MPRGWPSGLVAGVDEAGRGPLAGPVTAAAVVLDPERVPEGLDDSKRLSPARREALSAAIHAAALAVCVASVPARAVDRLNVRRAALLAMRRAAEGLAVRPGLVLVDGLDRPPGLACPSEAVVGGDGRSVSIAAASIVAKVARDAMMRRAAERWPAYGFERHAGYGTAAHRAALARHGPCPLHRRTFGALKGREQGRAER